MYKRDYYFLKLYDNSKIVWISFSCADDKIYLSWNLKGLYTNMRKHGALT